MSKGSARRPSQVTSEALDEAWNLIFAKHNKQEATLCLVEKLEAEEVEEFLLDENSRKIV